MLISRKLNRFWDCSQDYRGRCTSLRRYKGMCKQRKHDHSRIQIHNRMINSERTFQDYSAKKFIELGYLYSNNLIGIVFDIIPSSEPAFTRTFILLNTIHKNFHSIIVKGIILSLKSFNISNSVLTKFMMLNLAFFAFLVFLTSKKNHCPYPKVFTSCCMIILYSLSETYEA